MRMDERQRRAAPGAGNPFPARTIPDSPDRVTPAAIPGLEISSAEDRRPAAEFDSAFGPVFPDRVRGSITAPPPA